MRVILFKVTVFSKKDDFYKTFIRRSMFDRTILVDKITLEKCEYTKSEKIFQ